MALLLNGKKWWLTFAVPHLSLALLVQIVAFRLVQPGPEHGFGLGKVSGFWKSLAQNLLGVQIRQWQSRLSKSGKGCFLVQQLSTLVDVLKRRRSRFQLRQDLSSLWSVLTGFSRRDVPDIDTISPRSEMIKRQLLRKVSQKWTSYTGN